MNDPIKLIWKYKNNNRRTQYALYIYIGNIPEQLKKILDKIQNLNFYDTLLNLTKDEYLQLEKYYNKNWYSKFFNSYHINTSIYQIKESTIMKNEIIQKYTQKWYDEHIEEHKLMERKLIYSYESLIKLDLEQKNRKKAKEAEFTKEAEDFNDYTTTKKLDIKKLFSIKEQKTQKGGFNNNFDDEFNLDGGFNNYIQSESELIGGYDDDHIDDIKDDEEIYHNKDDEDEDNKKKNRLMK